MTRLAQQLRRSFTMSLLILAFVLALQMGGARSSAVHGRVAGAAGSAGVAEGAKKKSDVIEITRKNFAHTVKEGKWFLEFYTPWCSHCNHLKPTWEQLATDLKGKVNVGKVDCDRDYPLCNRFHVKGYPTMIHVEDKKTRQYPESQFDDPRSKASLYAFALNGYRSVKAFNLLRSPFGPVESVKAAILHLSFQAQYRFFYELEMGRPMWVLCLAIIGMVVVVTSVLSVIILFLTGKAKQE